MSKIGFFGGAFNPPHSGHIEMARAALTEGFDKIIFVPSNNPPHKWCDTPFDMRVDMLNLATADEERFEICPIEGVDCDVHYSYRTVPALKALYDGECAFLIGGDSLADLDKWRNPEELVKQIPLFVFAREGCVGFDKALQHWRGVGADVSVADFVPRFVSSTLIRYRVQLGDFRDVDARVAAFIGENGLYSAFTPMIEKLRTALPDGRLQHTFRTATAAVEICLEADLDAMADKAFTAALLHDCAKAKRYDEAPNDEMPADSLGTRIEHQFYGAVTARDEYDIDDIEILDAIRYHSTAKPDMSTLDKIVYCADKIERGRSFAGVEELRRRTSDDLDDGFKASLAYSLEFLRARGEEIYPLTLAAAKYYNLT